MKSQRRSLAHWFEAIYAALFDYSVRRWHGNTDAASFITAAVLAGAWVTNAALTVGVVNANRRDLLSFIPSGLLATGVVITTFLIAYLAFLRGDRYEVIANEFQARPPAERKRFTLMAWTYLAISYASAGAFALIMARKSGQF